MEKIPAEIVRQIDAALGLAALHPRRYNNSCRTDRVQPMRGAHSPAIGKGTNAMLIYFMRHGETDWNIVRRMQGRSDIPLNQNGLRQAQEAAAAMRDIPIDRILTSPLQRAQQTAQAVAAGRDVPVLVEELLTEMDFGDLEGLLLRESPVCQTVFSDPTHYVPLGHGETYESLDERCRAVLTQLLPSLEGQYHHVLLCTHGAFIKGGRAHPALPSLQPVLGGPAPAQLLLHPAVVRERADHPAGAGQALLLSRSARQILTVFTL